MSTSSIPSFAVPVTKSDTDYITDTFRIPNVEAPIAFTSVNLTTNVITKVAHGYNDGDAVNVVNPGTTDLNPVGLKYVINKTADTIELSATPGGTAIDLGGTNTTAPTLRISERLVTRRVEGCISVVGAGTVRVLPAGHADTNVNAQAAGGAIDYTLAAGQTLPVIVKKVFSAGTSATGIVCNYDR